MPSRHRSNRHYCMEFLAFHTSTWDFHTRRMPNLKIVVLEERLVCGGVLYVILARSTCTVVHMLPTLILVPGMLFSQTHSRTTYYKYCRCGHFYLAWGVGFFGKTSTPDFHTRRDAISCKHIFFRLACLASHRHLHRLIRDSRHKGHPKKHLRCLAYEEPDATNKPVEWEG